MRLHISAFGRPAPQGSHELGGVGQFLDSSKYLKPWRAALRIAAFREFARLDVRPEQLPLFPASVPVVLEQCSFYLEDDQCRAAGTDEPTGVPDIDKLLRAVLDGLSANVERSGRVYADDSQVVEVRQLSKQRKIPGTRAGAFIVVSDGRA